MLKSVCKTVLILPLGLNFALTAIPSPSQSKPQLITSSYDYVGPDGHKFHVTVINGHPRQIADTTGIVVAFVDEQGNISKTGQGDLTGFDEALAAARAGKPSADMKVPVSPNPAPIISDAQLPVIAQTESVQPIQISFGSAGEVVIVQSGKTGRYLYDGTIRLQEEYGSPIDLHYTGNSAGQRAKETAKTWTMPALMLGVGKYNANLGNSWEFRQKGVVFYTLGDTAAELRSQHGRYNGLAKEAVRNAQAALDFAAASGKPLTAIAPGLPALVAFSKQ